MKKPKTKRKDPKRVAAARKGWETRRRNIALASASKRAEYRLISVLQTATMSAAEAELANALLAGSALAPASNYLWVRQ